MERDYKKKAGSEEVLISNATHVPSTDQCVWQESFEKMRSSTDSLKPISRSEIFVSKLKKIVESNKNIEEILDFVSQELAAAEDFVEKQIFWQNTIEFMNKYIYENYINTIDVDAKMTDRNYFFILSNFNRAFHKIISPEVRKAITKYVFLTIYMAPQSSKPGLGNAFMDALRNQLPQLGKYEPEREVSRLISTLLNIDEQESLLDNEKHEILNTFGLISSLKELRNSTESKPINSAAVALGNVVNRFMGLEDIIEKSMKISNKMNIGWGNYKEICITIIEKYKKVIEEIKEKPLVDTNRDEKWVEDVKALHTIANKILYELIPQQLTLFGELLYSEKFAVPVKHLINI